jgi:hypothetical protein
MLKEWMGLIKTIVLSMGEQLTKRHEPVLFFQEMLQPYHLTNKLQFSNSKNKTIKICKSALNLRKKMKELDKKVSY